MPEDDKWIALFRYLGAKYYDLQTGCAAMFILCERSKVFTREEFLELKAEVATSPDMVKLRGLLDQLADPKTVDVEKLLREFVGTVQ